MATMNPQERARSIWMSVKNNPLAANFIQPIPARSVKMRVVESLFTGDPEQDYAVITADALYGKPVVLGFIEYHSGLDGWKIVPGYPYRNKDGDYEWKTKRLIEGM
jgi:hypothetical protein